MQIVENFNTPLDAARSNTARHFVVPGLAAGAAFLGFEMLVGAMTGRVWSFPQAIVQTIGVGLPSQNLEVPQLLAGMAIHMVFSVALGALFIALAERFGITGRSLFITAVLFMWLESAVSIWLVLHTLFPATLPILFDAVPIWASIVGRTGFGVVLALTYRSDRREPLDAL